jgi:hypothetical protein
MTRTTHLRIVLERWLDPPIRIRARRASPYASSFPVEELDVETGAGERLALVWKDVGPETLMADAWRARHGTPPDPTREPRAYDLLERADVGAPCRYAVLRRPGRTWLFLERVEGTRLDHAADLDAWRVVARWLAQAHGRLAARAGESAWPPRWRAPELDELLAAAPDDDRRRRVAALAAPLEGARARLAELAPAVIHGELYPANVLIADGGRVCALDWETIARGPALLDLAMLSAGVWSEPGETIAEAYRAALPDPPTAGELLADLDACRLLVAAGWLTAPADWTPPREQTRDWLADAELVAERLRA